MSIITNFCYITILILGLLPKLRYEKEGGSKECVKLKHIHTNVKKCKQVNPYI
jgi:hypothetical protein